MKKAGLFTAMNEEKRTSKRRFLEEMERVVPWKKIENLLSKHWEESPKRRPRADKMQLYRVYCLQQWFNLSDQQAEDEVHDCIPFFEFVGIGMTGKSFDATTMCKFRRWMEKHNLAEKIFEMTTKMLEEKGYLLKRGTSVDATIIKAPNSTKNRSGKRDEEMSSTRKNGQYYFGAKGHIGADSESGIIHSVGFTTAKVHDSKMMDSLLHGEEKAVFADAAYISKDRKRSCRKKGVYYGITERKVRGKKGQKAKELSTSQKKRNKRNSRVRVYVEHPFRVIKCIFKHTKVRYKGLRKNAQQFVALCTFANLYKVRKAF